MASPGLNSLEVKLAPSGHIWVAATTAAAPVNVTAAMTTVDPLWQDLGYATENGVTLTPASTNKDIPAWQVATPVKVVQTGVNFDIKYDLLQYTQEALSLFLFGSTGTASGGVFTQTVLSNPNPLQKSVTIEWTDDYGFINRFYVPITIVTDHQQIQLRRTDAVTIGVTHRALDASGTLAKLLSNDPHLLSDS